MSEATKPAAMIKLPELKRPQETYHVGSVTSQSAYRDQIIRAALPDGVEYCIVDTPTGPNADVSLGEISRRKGIGFAEPVSIPEDVKKVLRPNQTIMVIASDTLASYNRAAFDRSVSWEEENTTIEGDGQNLTGLEHRKTTLEPVRVGGGQPVED